VEQWAADVWVDVGRSIDPRLVAGADWPGLAAALDRAYRAGYDVQQHLPRLAAQQPLPDLRPARALHYRLVEECEAAITPIPAKVQHDDDAERTAGATRRLRTEAERLDNQRASTPERSVAAEINTPPRLVTGPVRPAVPERRGPQR
jgi:hypothetical protein